MTHEPIVLPRKLANQILHCAQNAPNRKIHGLISARDGMPHMCHPLQEGGTGEASFRIVQQMAACGETPFAAFHSGQSVMSAPESLSNDVFPVHVHLIISLDTRGVLDMRAYTLDDSNQLKEIELVLACE